MANLIMWRTFALITLICSMDFSDATISLLADPNMLPVSSSMANRVPTILVGCANERLKCLGGSVKF